jgi:hypothetical protein
MKRFLIFPIIALVFSCAPKEENYLENGLKNLENHRNVNEVFLKEFGLSKVGIIKEPDSLNIVFLLDKNTKKEVVEKYRIGFRCYVKYNDRSHISYDFDPFVEEVNDYNYIIKKIKPPVNKVDSIDFYLYDRSEYKGRTFGNHILIKNIKFR